MKTDIKNKYHRFQILAPRFLWLILVSCLLLLVAISVFAAEYLIVSSAAEFSVGQEFQADIFVDTEEEIVNAFEVEINYPAELLAVKELRDGDSIITFWVEKPRVSPENGQIIFSGIIPGGYGNRTGKLLSVVFAVKSKGDGNINFKNARALLNDGAGTDAKIKIKNFRFSVGETAPEIIVTQFIDNELPDNFVPIVARDANIFDGQWFLVFAAKDNGSGIDYYEIREDSPHFLPWTGGWRIVESPYLLKDQTLESRILVKAVDKAGNARIAAVEAANKVSWYENYAIFAILVMMAAFACLVWKFHHRIWKKK